MPTPIHKQPALPLSRALAIASRSLRVRLTRSLLTLLTIAMAIAFVTNTALTRLIPALAPSTADNHALPRTLWLLALSLLVSAVGIANAMLMTVMERFREIGTMKCLGALDAFILQLFLFESLLLGAAGSLAGVLLGFLLTLAQCLAHHHTSAWTSTLHPQGLAIAGAALLLGILMTTAAAAYPSWKAARMPPIEAMRVDV